MPFQKGNQYGSKKGFKHSEESKKKMRKSHLGKKLGPQSDDHIRKRLESRAEYKHSEESKRKISESHKGIPPWNKGLTKETDERVLQISKKLIGIIPSKETKEKQRKAKLGKKQTKEHIKNAAKTRIGRIMSKETREKSRYTHLGEKSALWKGGIDEDSSHNRAWILFGKDCCEICGITNDEHKELLNRRLSIHNTLKPKDYTVMESYAWLTACELGCHQKIERRPN